MPFIVRDSEGNIIKYNQITIKQHNDTFYCINPKCNCEYKYKSYNSNKINPHFCKLKSSQHVENCWGPLVDSISNDVDCFDLSDFSSETLLKKLSTSSITNHKQVASKPINSSERKIGYIHTLRQLKDFCLLNDNETILDQNTMIKDVFCGRKTQFLYTRYVTGIKLVECQYHHYDKKDRSIYFTYPYKSKPLIKLQIVFNSKKCFYKIKNELFKNPDKIVYIFATFKDDYSNSAIIYDEKQILRIELNK